jgi:hypothetical protein
MASDARKEGRKEGATPRGLSVAVVGLAIACAAACTGEPGLVGENVGEISAPLTVLGQEHTIISGDFPIFDLSTVWIPFQDATGRIVAAYTGGEGPVASDALTAPQTWITGTTGQTQQAWRDPPNPWPLPSNFCEVWPGGCDPVTGEITVEYDYVGAPVALTTDHVDVVAIVAVLYVRDFNAHDVVVVTSVDGGQAFTNARIVSTLNSGGHEFSDADRIDATAILSTYMATERDRDSTTKNIIVWRGGIREFEPKWWATEIIVDPTDGHVALLHDPRELLFVPDHAGHVTVRAWEEEGGGAETLAFLWSERRRRDGQAFGVFDTLPPCPTDETIQVRWWYRRLRGFFDHNINVSPNVVEPTILIDEDLAWHPCVGPSFSEPPALAFYVNSDRADMVVNRRPWLQVMAYTKTDPATGLARIFTATKNLLALGGLNGNTLHPDPLIEMLAGPVGTEEYNPKLALGQGFGLEFSIPGKDWPRVALIRKRVAGTTISIPGVLDQWEIKHPNDLFPGAWRWRSQATLALGATPIDFEGTTLGLTHQPICVFDDYGVCSSAGLVDRFFHATYPRSASFAVRGVAFGD